MARDLRDPIALGEAILNSTHYFTRDTPLSAICEVYNPAVRDYSANPGPLEKYGDPTKLPSTLPN